MQLRRLELRNYRRHVDTRIEVPDGVTALVGANGAGKSTVLEALGFALFGTDALRTSKTLLRTDSAAPGDSVGVLAELELAGQAISIHRELRGKALTPSATLTIDGAVVVPAGAGSSEAATQQLQRRLGMGPDAFFTAVIARQGELAALATQSPSDRKRLILRMLGVDKLDAAIVKGRESRRDAEAAVQALRVVLSDPAILAAQATEAARSADALAVALRDAEARLVAARALLANAAANAETAQRRADERRERAAAREALRRELQLLDHAAHAANAAAAEAEASHVRGQALAEQAAPYARLQDEWQVAQQRQQAAQHRAVLLHSMQRLEREAVAARSKLVGAPVPDAVPVAALDAAVQAGQQRVEELGASLEVARAGANAAEARLAHLGHLGAGAPCPTCERPLEGLAASLQERTRTAGAAARTQTESLARELALAKRALATAREHLSAAQTANHRREILAIERAAQGAAVADLDRRVVEARAALPPELPAIDVASVRRNLDAARAAHEARHALETLAQRAPALRDAATAAVARGHAHRNLVVAAEQELAANPEQAAALEAARLALVASQRGERQADLDVHTGRATLEASQRRVADLRQRTVEAEGMTARLVTAELELREWTALTDGRGGLLERFRDHVVDRIGPAIQAEASRLLAAFTGGRYTELLLDADYGLHLGDGGIRYSLDRFSGGEQDVAHLALRLAVSRLLAERAGGVELRFLALDEVFGHLDEERRGLVVAALHSLSGLYAQVLVVSHLASLNDALDQAITVQLVDGESKVTLRNG